jgi:hypothetical protein
VAVATEDIDAVTVAVEDRVAYIEGVVPTEGQRRAIVQAVQKIRGLKRVVACLAAERILPRQSADKKDLPLPAPVLMHYYSLS